MNTILLKHFSSVFLIFALTSVIASGEETTASLKMLPAPRKSARVPTPEQMGLIRTGGSTFDPPHVINPPVGKISPPVRKVENYFNNLVEKLLRVRPFDGKVKIKINLTADNSFSVSSKSLAEEEKNWTQYGGTQYGRQKTPAIDRNWPVRRWLNVKDHVTPIYTIDLSLGALRKFETEDEAAFFIARELFAIREDLYNPNHENGKLLAEQVESLAGDVEAMDWIRKADYAPEGAIAALERIYPKPDPDKKIYPVIDALRGKTHEGVRFAALQAEIENLRRKELRPLKEEMTKLPDFLDLKKNERKGRKLSSADFEELKKSTWKLVSEKFIYDSPVDYFRFMSSQNEPFYKTLEDLLIKASSDQNGELLLETISRIESLKIPNRAKGNAAIRMMLMMRRYGGNPPTPYFITSIEKMELALKLKRFTAGPDGWKAAAFLALHAAEVNAYDYSNTSAYSAAFSTEELQPIFANLYKIDPEYRTLINTTLEESRFTHPSQSRLKVLIQNIQSLDSSKAPLRDPLLDEAFRRLGEIDILSGMKSDQGLRILQDLKSLKKDAKLERVKSFSSPLIEKAENTFQEYYESKMRAIFKEPLKDLGKITNDIIFMNSVMEEFELSKNFREEAKPYLVRVAHEKVKNPKAYPKNRSTRDSEILEGKVADLFSEVLEENRISKSVRTEMIDFLLSCKDSNSVFSLSKPEQKRLTDAMRKSVLSMKPKEILAWVGRDLRAQYRHELAETLSNAQNYPIGDTDAEIDRLLVALDEGKAGVMTGLDPEDFKNETKIDVKMRDWLERADKFGGPVEHMIDIPFYRDMNILSLIATDEGSMKTLGEPFSFKDLETLLEIIENQRNRSEKLYKAARGFVNTGGENLLVLDSKAGSFLLDIFEKVGASAPSLQSRWDALEKIRKYSPIAMQERWQTMDKIGAKLADELGLLSPAEIREWLKKEHLLSSLPQDKMAPLLKKSMADDLKPGVTNERLGDEITKLNADISLQEKYPQAYLDFQNKIAEEFKIQPGSTETVFKDLTKTVGQDVRFASKETRGLSGLVSLSRKQSVKDQIDLIEYLMGRKEEMPAFIFTAGNDVEEISSLPAYIRETRARLATAETLERAMTTNAFLAGPNGFMATEEGLSTMMDYLLKDISAKNKETAFELANGLIRAEGKSRSLAVSYVLGQPVEEAGGKLAESRILKSLFEAYGVPGIKLGQYLAFTSELKDFREVLEELQDSAMPLTYLEGIRLCEERFGADWPSKITNIQIKEIKGSGSVNVALSYVESDTGREGVLSILRSNIENITRNDFERFRRFVVELTKTPAGELKYGYLHGLSSVIEESVRLEFDKVGALAMQNYVIPSYNETHFGWSVRTIEGWNSMHGANFTQLAKGKSARKILTKDPESYRYAMMALSQVEMDRLLGIGSDGSPHPIALYANPDFHDGQVLIELETKTATILDFGQAVKITNQERELGVEILRVISKKAETAKSAAHLLNTSSILKRMGAQIAIADIEKIFERTERMDIFIQLLSLLNRSKMPVPISTIHWVLAVNRQIALGDKIGINNVHVFEHLVATNKLGLPGSFYNTLRLAKRKICQTFLDEPWKPSKTTPWYRRWFSPSTH